MALSKEEKGAVINDGGSLPGCQFRKSGSGTSLGGRSLNQHLRKIGGDLTGPSWVPSEEWFGVLGGQSWSEWAQSSAEPRWKVEQFGHLERVH